MEINPRKELLGKLLGEFIKHYLVFKKVPIKGVITYVHGFED
jgi:hypothetical protein